MFRRGRPVDDVAAEIESHLQLEIDRLRAEGLSPDEAKMAARRVFSNVALSTERFYESQRWYWWDQLTQAAALTVVAWCACYIPARRAVGIDPLPAPRNQGRRLISPDRRPHQRRGQGDHDDARRPRDDVGGARIGVGAHQIDAIDQGQHKEQHERQQNAVGDLR